MRLGVRPALRWNSHGDRFQQRALLIFTVQRSANLNSRFHQELQKASASPRLSRILAALLDASLIMKTFSHYTSEDLERSASHHLELAQALAMRDAEWAGSVMRSHVLAAKRSLRRR